MWIFFLNMNVSWKWMNIPILFQIQYFSIVNIWYLCKITAVDRINLNALMHNTLLFWYSFPNYFQCYRMVQINLCLFTVQKKWTLPMYHCCILFFSFAFIIEIISNLCVNIMQALTIAMVTNLDHHRNKQVVVWLTPMSKVESSFPF